MRWVMAGLVVVGAVLVGDAAAAGRVELVVIADRQTPLLAQQTWARELSRAGVRSVRMRQGLTSGGPSIETRGAGGAPVYVVTGVLDGRGDLVLPGGRYRNGEARRAARWLDELARLGPPESREPIVAFGLTQSQMAAVRADLAVPVGFSTLGRPRGEVVRKIIAQLKLPVHVDDRLLPAGRNDRVADELRGLSSGTALAAVLRPAGLALAPEATDAGPECRITTLVGQQESWPVGWKPKKLLSQFQPKFFARVTISLTKISGSDVLAEISKRIETPVLVDHAVLARQGVDLGKPVNLPKTKTTYADLLDRALFQLRLKCDLRADEAERPFLWVTTLKR